jgi:predicted nucleic acid-binding Zn ribbon protein
MGWSRVASDERSTGAQVAKEALDQARKAAAASRLTSERAAAGKRRGHTRAANEADARSRAAGATGAGSDPVAFGVAIDDLLDDRGWEADVKVARVTADWASIVGMEIAEHCEPVSLRDGVLTVEAESTAWATQIRLLGRQILQRITDVVGPQIVEKLVVRGPAGPSWRHGRLRVPGLGPRDTYG